MFHKFCSSIPSCRFIFKSGKTAHFVCGQYATQQEDEIEELNAEIKKGHPHFYIDVNEKTIESDKIDPLAHLKKKIIDEFLEGQRNALNKDMGNSVSKGSGMVTTAAVTTSK